MDVTPAITAQFGWLVRTELHRRLVAAHLDGLPVFENCPQGCSCDESDRIYECAKQLQFEGKMESAINQLADLRSGHIVCLRDTATSDH
jgi:hypothetical protein